MCVGVCVREREREGRQLVNEALLCVTVSVCVCVCVRERERERVES